MAAAEVQPRAEGEPTTPRSKNTGPRMAFDPPKIADNPNGWGPTGVPERFRDLPFQMFNKAERIGKIADWTGTFYSEKKYGGGRYQNQYNQPGGGQIGTQYAYFHDEEDANFQLVDTQKTQRGGGMRGGGGGRMRFQQQQLRRQAQRERERRMQQVTLQAGGKGAKIREKDRMRRYRQAYQRQFGQRQRYDQRGPAASKNRQPSVQIKPDWEVLEEMDFPRLQKLNLPSVGEGQDVDGERYGTILFYDKNYDRVTTRNERPLSRVHKNFYTVTTTDDPVIQRLARQHKDLKVFATDAILATLMCCTRSVNSWDIVVHRIGDKLFFDKRDKSEIDSLTVSETATEPPLEDDKSINSAKNLALEALYINRNFSQQVLLDDGKAHKMDHPQIPFVDERTPAKDIASVGYRYRKWDLGNGILLVSRCEHDGVTVGPNGEIQFLTVKSFNEWDSRYSGGVDWRSKIDSQRGAVLATELKNNSGKLAKWTVQALLSGSDQIKFGYVSRAHVRDSTKHVILSTQQFKPAELANQITLNMDNAWGILRCMVDLCMRQPPGKYLLMKDPNKTVVRLYKIPQNTFEDDEEGEEEEDDEEEEEEDDDDDEDEPEGEAGGQEGEKSAK